MKISVIIPCYNCENTIYECIFSVLQQDYSVFEIICIDDGSTDNTLLILEKIESELSIENLNFIILQQKNSGPANARNNGIKHAKGDWIAFLDSDDYWSMNKIKNDIIFLENNPDVKILGSKKMNQSFRYISFSRLLYKNFFKTSSVLVEKKCILKNLFDSQQRYSEDYKVWLNIIYNNKGAIISPQTSFSIDEYKENAGSFHGKGLSSNLWDMQKGELLNYLYFFKEKKVSFVNLILLVIWSSFKYFVRLLRTKLRL